MDGVFVRGKFTKLYNLIGLACGLFSTLLFTFVLIVDKSVTWDYVLLVCGIIFFALLTSVICAVSLYVNQRTFLHVDDEHISAFCHYGFSLECKLTDVDQLTYGGNGLNIRLKNGKKYNLMNLGNAYRVGRFIARRIPGKPAPTCTKEELAAQIQVIQKKRNIEAVAALSGFVLLIPLALAISALTGKGAWKIGAIMTALGVLVVAIACMALRRALRHAEMLGDLRQSISLLVFRTTLPPCDNLIEVFADCTMSDPTRLTVYAVPDSERVYCIVERVNENFELEYIHQYAYRDMQELHNELEDLLEISLIK